MAEHALCRRDWVGPTSWVSSPLSSGFSTWHQIRYWYHPLSLITCANLNLADYNSAFPAGVNVAATWDRGLAYARGTAMGTEHREKGSDVMLGPAAGPLGRAPAGGRNWEGFRFVFVQKYLLTYSSRTLVLIQSLLVSCLPILLEAFRMPES